jgi:hypothetical protein
MAEHVFISYRREDSAGHAGRLCDALSARLGPERVFMDLEGIAAGADFPTALARELERAQTVLVLIGPRWLAAADAHGARRLDAPQDYVRLEIQAALDSGKRVLPVLVGGATMPSEGHLPEAIAALARRQAVTLSDARWAADLEGLVAALAPPTTTAAAPRPTRRSWTVRAAALVAIAAILGGLTWWRLGPPEPGTAPATARTMPSLIGLPIDQARARVAGLGLTVRAVPGTEPGVPGSVTGQSIAPGLVPSSGAVLELTLAAAGEAEVPNLTLYSLAEARAALAARGLQVGEVAARAGGAARAGLVLEQRPAPFARVPAGTRVDLVLSEERR